jgi:hypothetical protein
MASARRSRVAPVPDFDGSAEARATELVLGFESESAVAASFKPQHLYELKITLVDITPKQHGDLIEIETSLAKYPLLEGLVGPTAAALDCFQPLKHALKTWMHPMDVGESSHLTLRAVLSIVKGMPGFAAVTPAVLAAAIVFHDFHCGDEWLEAPVGKLDKWPVCARFWDLYVAKTLLSSTAPQVELFHKKVITAARAIGIGPVRLVGHRSLLRLAREYDLILSTVPSSHPRFVRKNILDCLVEVFTIAENAKALRHACTADCFDCMSVPLQHAPLVALPWSAGLLEELRNYKTINYVHLDEIARIAAHYAWLFVATCHVRFPLTEYDATRWQDVDVLWDVWTPA